MTGHTPWREIRHKPQPDGLDVNPDEGIFDLHTVDGILDHLAHCDDEVINGVREGLIEWDRARQRREDLSLRPRPGETAEDAVNRVIEAARRYS